MSDPTTPTPAPKTTESWFRRKWVIGVASGLVGLVIGAGSSAADPKESDAYKAVSAELQDTKDDSATLQEQVDQVDERSSELDSRQKELDTRANAISDDAKAVSKREEAVGKTEKKIKANTIDGDGIYKVGSDIKAGTYKTKGGSACYYAILNSTDTSDIADNNNITGPGFLTVRDGQYLELSGCTDWVRQ